MIRLTIGQADAIRRHAEADYPHECCGLLIGTIDGDGLKHVEEVFPIPNAREISAKRTRFLITPDQILRGEYHARLSGRELVGFYHSHPDCPAVPSRCDLDRAWPDYSYIIVSARRGGAGMLLSWQLSTDRSRFDPEGILSEPYTRPVPCV